jgi:CBS domain-containing protein
MERMPVVEGESVIGLVSIGDIVKSMIEAQERLIGDLERYITGSPR